MMSVLIDNQSVTQEIQREIAENMIRASVGWVSSYTLLCLVLRLDAQKIRELSRGEKKIDGLSSYLQSEVESICQALTYNKEFFENLMERIASPDSEPTDAIICKTVERCLLDFVRFSSELLVHCGLLDTQIAQFVHNTDVALNDALAIMSITFFGVFTIRNSPKNERFTIRLLKNVIMR
ncbi:hypothetical protein CRE_28904 [Caenorhabditis remanei]|uniref:Uncharacterized protein n=1 Tax=Caenorhabditis remanei TaxID=31234 RepID=E3MXF7_CAERE|nr:hypothetical protein CRE_28904 [Caenorhabditis remanei]